MYKLLINIHRTVVSPVILFGCETWSLTRERYKLGIFENRMIRRIFEYKREK
jgi:hypothetical protein